MNTKWICGLSLAALVGCSPAVDSAAPSPAPSAESELSPTPKNMQSARPKIYDASAHGFEQIETALTVAKQDDKRVLLQFGAEWCGWCHLLHRLFGSDEQIAAKLNSDYVVVLIDVDGDHNKLVNEKYGIPMQHGLPVLVVLDSAGTQLTTQNTSELEEGDHHDPERVMAFLEKWSSGEGK